MTFGSHLQSIIDYQLDHPVPDMMDTYYLPTTRMMEAHTSILQMLNNARDEANPPKSPLAPKIPEGLYQTFQNLVDMKMGVEKQWSQEQQEAEAAKIPAYTPVSLLDIDGLPEEQQEAVQNAMAEALHERFDLAAGRLKVRGKECLICVQGAFTQNAKAQWVAHTDPQAVVQFFAMAVAKGLTDEKSLEDRGLMSERQRYETRLLAQQLREEGVKPLIASPIYRSEGESLLDARTNSAVFGKKPHQQSASADISDVGYGAEDLANAENFTKSAPQKFVPPDTADLAPVHYQGAVAMPPAQKSKL